MKRNENLLTYDREDTVGKLLDLCEALGRIPTNKEMVDDGVVKCSKTMVGICNDLGYKDRYEYCRLNGYGKKGDILIGSVYKHASDMTTDDYRIIWHEFNDKHGKFPSTQDCNIRYKMNYNLPNTSNLDDFMNENSLSLNKFRDLIGDTTRQIPTVALYDDYIEIYKHESKKQGKPLDCSDLVCNSFGLPSSRWLVDNCPSERMTSFNEFVEHCGFTPNYEMSKKMVTKIIYSMGDKIDRPLMINDFKNPQDDEVGISIINSHWGTMNKMKKELGLEIVNETTTKDWNVDKVRDDLIAICEQVERNYNRKRISRLDIKEFGTISYSSQQKYLLKDGSSIREFVDSIGFEMQLAGRGITTNYEDGEVTLSQYETEFTNYLRGELNLQYNLDYSRGVRYNKFIKHYEGYMDCDYTIKYNNSLIYVEVAGVLRDYKKWYYEGKSINSKSRERYRKSLQEKEDMLKESGLRYHIIFPDDMDVDYLNDIFNNTNIEYNKEDKIE